MASVFSMFSIDTGTVIKADGMSGRGVIIDGYTFNMTCRVAIKAGKMYSAKGEILAYQGFVTFDSSYDVAVGDTFVYDNVRYRFVFIEPKRLPFGQSVESRGFLQCRV